MTRVDVKNEAVSLFTVRNTAELYSINWWTCGHTSTGVSDAREVEFRTAHANRQVGRKEGRQDYL